MRMRTLAAGLTLAVLAPACSGRFGPEDTALRSSTTVVRPEVVQVPTPVAVPTTSPWLVGLLGLAIVGLIMVSLFLAMGRTGHAAQPAQQPPPLQPLELPDGRHFLNDSEGRWWEMLSLPSGDIVHVPMFGAPPLTDDGEG